MKVEEKLRPLEDVAAMLLDAYTEWKSWEGQKNSLKDEFFALADREVTKQGLAVKMVDLPAATEAKATERVQRHHPGWRIQELRRERSNRLNHWEVVLIEDPAFKPYAFEVNGHKLARQVSKGAVMLDEEWLAEESPELYAEVTYTLPWGQVVAVPIEALAPERVAQIGRYIYNEKPRVSLARPRPVKEDE